MKWRIAAKRLAPLLGALALGAALAGQPQFVAPLVALAEAVESLADNKSSSSLSRTATPAPLVLTE